MANNIQIQATWGTQKSLDELSKAIAERTQYLKGQTTEMAVTATCINVLKSIRALTSVVGKKPNVIDGHWKISISTTSAESGWARPPRKAKNGRRVFREGGGAKDTSSNGNRVVNLAGKYSKVGEANIQVFKLRITNTTTRNTFYESLVLANSKDVVFQFAQKRIMRRIAQYRGISKRMLGLLMKKVHAAQNVSDQQQAMPVNSKPLPTAFMNQLAFVNKQGNGFSSGTFGVSVEDGLTNSLLALKNGQSDLNLALQRAANSTTAIINKAIEKSGFGDKLTIPFPEISK